MDGELEIFFSKEPFSDFDAEKRKLVEGSSRFFNFRKGQTLVRKGELGATVYFITKGSCGVFAEEPGGGEQMVARLSAGDFFGEIAVMAGVPRTATVRTLEDVRVATLEANSFRKYFLSDPAALHKFDQYYKKRLSRLNLVRRRMSRTGREKDTLAGKIRKFLGIG